MSKRTGNHSIMSLLLIYTVMICTILVHNQQLSISSGTANSFFVNALTLSLPKKHIFHENSTSSNDTSSMHLHRPTPFRKKKRSNGTTSTILLSSTSRNNKTTGTIHSFSTNNNSGKTKQNLFKSILIKPFTMAQKPFVLVPIIITLIYKLLSNQSIRQSINTFFIQFPYIAAFVICASKACIADLVVQKSEAASSSTSSSSTKPSKSSFEYKRNLAFFFYGGAYQGCVQEHIFNHIYPYLFGNGVDIRTVGIKVLVDLFFISPFICLPIAYMIKGAIYKNSLVSSIKRYIHDARVNNLLLKNWIVWGPAQSITFSIVPEQYRISFIAFISFFWLLILSSISGKKVKLE